VPFFTCGSDPHPPCKSVGAGVSFIFHPWVTRRYPKFHILMVLIQLAHLNSCQSQSFCLAQHYPPLKSHTVTQGGVHLTHQLRSSLGSSIHRALVIEFTSTLLKPVGDPKPSGCERWCDFSPVGVTAGGFGWVRECGCGRVFVKLAPLPSLVVEHSSGLGDIGLSHVGTRGVLQP
jgi:hypothetical protein